MDRLFYSAAKRVFLFFLEGFVFVSLLIFPVRGIADSLHVEIGQYIESESSIIEGSTSIEDKLIGYLSRGDSYLIQEDYKRAFEDYHEVYCLKGLLPQEDQSFYLFWSLVGEAISLSNQEEYVLADNRISELEYLLQTVSWNYHSFSIPPTPPICGPDVVSAKWCK